MRKIFLNSTKPISLLVSLFLMLILSGAIIASLFLSDLTLKKLAQSQYLQSKISQVLEENEIFSEGLISIEFNTFSSANITVEKAKLSSFGDIIGYDINLKVDVIKYWLGIIFIDEVSIMNMMFSLPNDLSINLDDMSDLNLKLFNQSLGDPLNKIKSKSIYINKGVLKFQSQKFDFNSIYIAKNEKLLTAKASFKHKSNAEDATVSATVNLSLNNANIMEFNIDAQGIDYNSFFYLDKDPKNVLFFVNSLIKNSGLYEKKNNKIKLVGTYDLSSTTLNLGLTDIHNRFKFSSSIDMLNSLKNNSLLLEKTELLLGDYSLLVSDANFNFVNRTFETSITQFLIPYQSSSVFPSKVKVFGAFPIEDGNIAKINIIGKNPSNLKASLEMVETTNGTVNKDASFDFFLEVDGLQKINLNKFGSSLGITSTVGNKEINLSNAIAQISFKSSTQNVVLDSFKGKIKNLIYFENNKPLVELANIDLKGNLKQGYAAINSITKLEPSINKYKDIKVEVSSTDNVDRKREITLSFKSKISDLFSLAQIPKSDVTWMNFLDRSNGGEEVSITYSKAIALNRIEKFFAPEENMFELSVKNLSIPINTKNTINFGKLKLKGLGNTIFFEALMAANNKKISGSLNNLRSKIFSRDKTGNLIVFFDDLDSETLFPNFSTFSVKGPMKFTLLPVKKDDNTLIQGNIDLTKARVYVPALALNKTKGRYGQLKFNFTKDNKSNFRYSQKDVLVSGTGIHKSIFEINEVNYSSIKTPDIQIDRATFQKFGDYNQFKTDGGTISLEFLMRLKIRKKDTPLDFIFSDIVLTFNKNKFLNSLKGEIRSFEGLRGYTRAKLSPKSNLEITISPYKNNSINLVISGNDAGELLRRGKFYENGYGGIFKASIFYKNRTKISGFLEIEDFRIKNAPVLAQIISSASIIGLLDNLNGNGLLFTNIEGSFDYKDGELTLKDGVAVGPSLGLTMGGYERYGKKQNTVNVNGLVSPVYIINGVVKAIPLIGKVLGGEKGEGVFGVSYKVQGNSSNPRVLVNPLSILTPGVFRKIFGMEKNGDR